MYRGSLVCAYGRAVMARHTSLAHQVSVGVCTRGYAKKVVEAKTEEKKERKVRQKEVKEPNKILLTREFNAPVESETPTISQQALEKLINGGGEEYVLIDLRTDKEIELAGDPIIPTSVKMPFAPLTHLNSYKPPKVKLDKKAKGKGAKAQKLAKAAAAKAQAPPKEESPTQRDVFRTSFRMTPATWQETYKFPKIGFTDNVIFYSSSNVRSSSVVNSAMKLGFTNVKVLEGGSRVWNKYHNILGRQTQ